MYRLDQIRSVQLEPSSFCNARCVSCIRNVGGYNHNTGYEERNLSLSDVKTILPISLVKQIHRVLYNGNLGDMLMNPEIVEITAWLLEVNPKLRIEAMTNGGAGSRALWQGLGKLGIQCNFALDGLEDTHHLYRQNTVWSTVIKNAQTFMQAGGKAVWKMIEFEHNRHQIDQCRELAAQLGFNKFWLLESAINRGPMAAFDHHGNFSHHIEPTPETVKHRPSAQDQINNIKKVFPIWLEYFKQDATQRKINCFAKKNKDLYINSVGEIYPCCFMGHQPKSILPEYYHSNFQIKELLKFNENNALKYPLEKCLEWFNLVQNTWQYDSIKQGGLKVCHDNCGNSDYWWKSKFTEQKLEVEKC